MTRVITGSHPFLEKTLFYTIYANNKLAKITSLLDNGGRILFTFDEIEVDVVGIYTSGPSRVGVFCEFTSQEEPRYIINSTNSGASFTRVQELSIRILRPYDNTHACFKDLLNPNLIWAALLESNYMTAPPPPMLRIRWTTNGGTSWNLLSPAYNYNYLTVHAFAVPSHDGRYAYVVDNRTFTLEPYDYHVVIWKIDSTGHNPPEAWELPSGGYLDDKGFIYGTCRYGDPDTLYLMTSDWKSLYKLTWSTSDIELLYDGNPDNGEPFDETQRDTKQIMTTKTGTLLTVSSPWRLSLSPYLHIFRSEDAGASWSKIDCSDLIPLHYSTAPQIYRSPYIDRIAQSGDILFMAFEEEYSVARGNYSNGDLRGIYSIDDGATWQSTGILSNQPGEEWYPTDNQGT